MSRQKILCILQALQISKKRPEEWKKSACSTLKKNQTKSVLAFLSKIIYTCPIMTWEKCSYIFCVDILAEILSLSKLVELQSLACVGQIFQPFASSILSPSIFLWREEFGGLLEIQHKLNCPKKGILILRVLILKVYVWFLLGLLLSTSISLFSYCSGN